MIADERGQNDMNNCHHFDKAGQRQQAREAGPPWVAAAAWEELIPAECRLSATQLSGSNTVGGG